MYEGHSPVLFLVVICDWRTLAGMLAPTPHVLSMDRHTEFLVAVAEGC